MLNKNMTYATMLLSLVVSTVAAGGTDAGDNDVKKKATFFTPFGITILVIAAL